MDRIPPDPNKVFTTHPEQLDMTDDDLDAFLDSVLDEMDLPPQEEFTPPPAVLACSGGVPAVTAEMLQKMMQDTNFLKFMSGFIESSFGRQLLLTQCSEEDCNQIVQNLRDPEKSQELQLAMKSPDVLNYIKQGMDHGQGILSNLTGTDPSDPRERETISRVVYYEFNIDFLRQEVYQLKTRIVPMLVENGVAKEYLVCDSKLFKENSRLIEDFMFGNKNVDIKKHGTVISKEEGEQKIEELTGLSLSNDQTAGNTACLKAFDPEFEQGDIPPIMVEDRHLRYELTIAEIGALEGNYTFIKPYCLGMSDFEAQKKTLLENSVTSNEALEAHRQKLLQSRFGADYSPFKKAARECLIEQYQARVK